MDLWRLLVLLGWWTSGIIIFVIPMDVMSSIYVQCLRDESAHAMCPSLTSHSPVLSFLDPGPNKALYWIWRVIYWSSYVAIWAVYPLLMSYANSPEFKQSKRWWGALKSNLLYYGLYAAAGALILVYISVKNRGMTFRNIMGTAILISNTLGLLMVIVLLSIGLVRIPRNLWRLSRRPIMMKHYLWHISDAHQEYEVAKRALMNVYKVVRNADRQLSKHDHNRKYLEKVIAAISSDEWANVVIGEGDYVASYDGMVALHGKVLAAQWDQVRTQAVYLDFLQKALRLEDVLEHSRSSQVFWRSAIRWSFASKRNYWGAMIVNRVESWYYRYVEPLFLKLLALFCALLSVTVIWTEVTQFSLSFLNVDLSLFSLMLNTAYTPFAVEMLVWIPVTYLTLCIFSSLFSIRVFSYYRFLPGGGTNARTLLMSASYMGRLVPPLIFNYMLMIHCGPNLVRDSAFSELMGTMEVGGIFNLFFPVVLVVLVGIVLLNLGDRILAVFRVRQFQYDEHFDDESISAGERILRTEKLAMGRQMELTDEEELEEELDGSIILGNSNSEGVRFLPAGPEVVVQGESGMRAAPLPSRKARLPRGQAGLLRSLSDMPGDRVDVSSDSLIPKGSIGSASVNSGGSNAASGSGNSVLDDILDI